MVRWRRCSRRRVLLCLPRASRSKGLGTTSIRTRVGQSKDHNDCKILAASGRLQRCIEKCINTPKTGAQSRLGAIFQYGCQDEDYQVLSTCAPTNALKLISEVKATRRMCGWDHIQPLHRSRMSRNSSTVIPKLNMSVVVESPNSGLSSQLLAD
jgi:hypothetical protein